MRKVTVKGLVLLALAQAYGGAAFAGAGSAVEFRIGWDSTAQLYRVYMRPNATPSPNLSLSAQATIRVPHSSVTADQFTPSNVKSVYSGVFWSDTSAVQAPIEDTSVDYISFTPTIVNAQAFPWVANQEIEVFNFANAGKCLGVVELVDNTTDPFVINDPNSVGTNPGNQFSNLGWGTADTNNYTNNYGGTADCRAAGVNNNPTANVDSYTVVTGNSVTADVLVNDSDLDGDIVSITTFTQGAHGTVTKVGSDLVYTPTGGYVGADTFTYTISDGNGGTSTGTVNMTVQAATNTNHAPTAVNDTATGSAGSALTINVLGNDSDADGDILTIASVTQGAHGAVAISAGKVVYTPAAGYAGADSFTYTVSDGKGGSTTATVSVTVTAVNSKPTVVNDSGSVTAGSAATIDVLANDSDPDGDTLTIASVTQGAHGTVTISNGKVVYTPAAGYVGSDSFTYTVSDGKGGSSTATVAMTVNAGNSKPNVVNDTAAVTAGSAATIDVLANDSDPDGDTLTIASVTQGAHGTVTISNGKVVYTSAAGYVGSDSFTYTVSDGKGGSSTATVAMTVNAGNSKPNVANDTATLTTGGSATIDVLANDSDADGDTLTIASVTQGAHGIVTISAGKVVYTPAAGYVGSDSFTYTVSDGKGGSSTATVAMTVNAVPACSSSPSNPQANQIYYRLAYDATAKRYRVYFNPASLPVGKNLSLTGQVTIKVSHASVAANQFKIDENDLVSAVSGTNWSVVSKISAPAEDPASDYISFNLTATNQSAYNWVAGTELEAFSFTNMATCDTSIQAVVMSNSDPFNSIPNSTGTNPGNQFTNLGWGTASTNNFGGAYGCAVAVSSCSTGPVDSDGDGLTDAEEAILGTNPNDPDSDHDGIPDKTEVAAGGVSNPADTDGDGKIDALDSDDDNDGILTKNENYHGSVLNEDTDGDGTPDYRDPDDDGDGVLTAQENPDPNKDGSPSDALDGDNNGVPDYLDPNYYPTAQTVKPVPTLSEWAKILLSMLLGGLAWVSFKRRRQ